MLFHLNLCLICYILYRELHNRVPPVPGVGDEKRGGGVHLPPLHARQAKIVVYNVFVVEIIREEGKYSFIRVQ